MGVTGFVRYLTRVKHRHLSRTLASEQLHVGVAAKKTLQYRIVLRNISRLAIAALQKQQDGTYIDRFVPEERRVRGTGYGFSYGTRIAAIETVEACLVTYLARVPVATVFVLTMFETLNVVLVDEAPCAIVIAAVHDFLVRPIIRACLERGAIVDPEGLRQMNRTIRSERRANRTRVKLDPAVFVPVKTVADVVHKGRTPHQAVQVKRTTALSFEDAEDSLGEAEDAPPRNLFFCE
jgi:hypothetical protein